MVKIGLIGSIASLQQYVVQIGKIPGYEIVGKSSVGMMDQHGIQPLSVPEYARNTLFDAADAVIIEKPSMVSYDLLKDAIRKYKHIYFADTPELLPAQCLELQKLVIEAGTIVQVRNPLIDNHVARWISQNLSEPAYVGYFKSHSKMPEKRRLLMPVLLFAQYLFQKSPQKVRVTGSYQAETGFTFINVRLDYSTYSALNLEVLASAEDEDRYRVAFPGIFMESPAEDQIIVNKQALQIDAFRKSELSCFLDNLESGHMKEGSGLQVLYPAYLTYEEVARKLQQYIPWYSY